ncbi:MAG: Rieske 2Fe-2S domain-containing protein [Acidobacteriota bacterium]|nr:Rieske 2Fe-2S domain-containing protein [Acidobacteriota bacterium]
MTVKAGKPQSRLDPEPMPRRDFLGLSALWTMAGALLFSVFGMLKLPKAAVLSSPSKKFTVTLPETLAAGEAFVPPGRAVAMFRDSEGVHAVSTICTHLGCVVKPTTEGFECPCHGSRFAVDGEVTRGPAPKALAWLKVSNKGGAWVVDEDTKVPPGTKEKA